MQKALSGFVYTLLLCISTAVVFAQDNGGPSTGFVPGRLLIKFKDGVADGRARGLLADRGAFSADVIPQIGVHIVQLPPLANEQAEANAFKGLDEVEFAEVDGLREPSLITPNDPQFPYQWEMGTIQNTTAWSVTTGSSSITIGLIDTGVLGTHPDLAGNLVPGWNFYDNNSDTSDSMYHGTYMAGTLAAVSNNGLGVAGTCWYCKIMPLKVANASSIGTDSVIANAVLYAMNHGIRIAVIGYAVTASQTITAAAQQLVAAGGVVIVPSGNDGLLLSTPANSAMITVGGTDPSDNVATFSNTGPLVDLSAPAYTYSTDPFGSYSATQGTSYSAAYTAGVAALILSVNSSCSSAAIKQILENSADDLGAAGWDSGFGWGRLNASNAVNSAASGGCAGTTVNSPAPVITSALTTSGTVGTTFGYQITASNSPTSYNATGLPSGLSVNTSNGAVSGTPTVSGSFNVTLSATNSGGTGTAILALTISASAPPPPSITSPLTASGAQNSPFSYQITASNSPTSYNATGLPSGLSVNTSNGAVSGTPTVSGSFNVTLSAANSGGTGTAILALTISASAPPPPSITSPLTASGAQNSPFSYQITASNSPTSYNATGLPSGLSVNTSNGAVSGTPTVSGSFNVTLSATNSGGTGTATLALTISPAAPPPAPVITSSLSSSGTVNRSFSYQITATNSPTGFGASGLPSGISVNTATGLISGTPSVAGTYSVSLTATNSGGTGTAVLTLTINAKNGKGKP